MADYASLYAALSDKAPQLDEKGFPVGTSSGIENSFAPDEYAKRYIARMNAAPMYKAIASPQAQPAPTPVSAASLQQLASGMKSVK